MKLLRCLSLCLLAQFTLSGRLPAVEAGSAYEQAVKAYVDAAGDEMRSLRMQVDEAFKATPAERQGAYKDLYAKLEKCEQIHQKLKTAPAQDFDETKELYEQKRLEAVKAWTKIRGG